MSGLLLDTPAYSALFRGHEAIVEAVQAAASVALTPVVIGELLAGFRRGARRKQNESELAAFLAKPRAEVLTVDAGTAERYAAIVTGLRTAGVTVSTNDLWIAASAMQHGRTVLTTDADFLRIPQILVDHRPARA